MYQKFLVIMLIGLSLIGNAHAADVIGHGFCRISEIFTSTTHAVGLLLIIEMGILAMLSRLTWGLTILHGAGIAVTEGAATIVDLIAPVVVSCT